MSTLNSLHSAPRQLSPKAVGILAAVVTILIWSSFIVIARASAKGSLLPLDMVFLRFIGAGLVLLPWGWWLVRSQKLSRSISWLGLSPYAFKLTALVGTIGGVGYAMLAYSGFFFAPAAHASVLLHVRCGQNSLVACHLASSGEGLGVSRIDTRCWPSRPM
jgi:drug/metabolite transporter (DMT)-like permease